MGHHFVEEIGAVLYAGIFQPVIVAAPKYKLVTNEAAGLEWLVQRPAARETLNHGNQWRSAMMKISPVSIVSSLPVQAIGVNLTPYPVLSASSLTDLLRRVRVAAEAVESGICQLDSWLGEFRNAPDETWDAAANAMAVLENANLDIQSAVEDVGLATKHFG
jgi:hypothetical protein